MTKPPDSDQEFEPGLIEVKFRDGLRIRLRDGFPRDLDGGTLTRPEARSLFDRGKWNRTFSPAEDEIDKLTARAREQSDTAPPDLNLYFRVRLSLNADPDAMVRDLKALPEVEAAYRVSKPLPPPLAPDFSTPAPADAPPRSYQGYLDASPAGIDARFAWDLGFDGSGITIVDIEFNWDRNHGDLKPPMLIGPERDPPPGRGFGPYHGTAVLGTYAGISNGWGVRGIASGTATGIAAVRNAEDNNVANTIMRAIGELKDAEGAVLLIETQATGPFGATRPVAAEFVRSTYDAIRLGTAFGITIVEAAGNGGLNLGDSAFTGDHNPFVPGNESGAIIVSASQGGPDNRSPQGNQPGNGCFGPRVDVHAWGMGVVTTIGAERPHEIDDANEIVYNEGATCFWRNFSGTSAASAIVAGAAAIFQHFFITTNERPARPDEVRSIFRETGTPQGGDATGQRIGPMPDLKKAIETTLTRQEIPSPILDPSSGFAIKWPAFFGPTNPEWQVRINYAPITDTTLSEVRYAFGATPTRLSARFDPSTDGYVLVSGPARLTARVFTRSSPTGLFSASPVTLGEYTVWDLSRVPGCTTVIALTIGFFLLLLAIAC